MLTKLEQYLAEIKAAADKAGSVSTVAYGLMSTHPFLTGATFGLGFVCGAVLARVL